MQRGGVMTRNGLLIVSSALLGLVMAGHVGRAQSSKVFVQDTEQAPPREMDVATRAQLHDPLFKLVISQHPEVIKFNDILAMIQPDRTKRRMFIVDEEIKSPHTPASRRAVIDFTESNAGLALDGRVMLSISLDSSTMPEALAFEAWAFDDTTGNFNFYKLDTAGSNLLTWKLRDSSREAGSLALSADARRGRCLRCHASGVPVMKELALPWNNWQSGQSTNSYLFKQQGSPPWPVTTDPNYIEPSDAYAFEATIEAAIRRFNLGKFDQQANLDGQGAINISNAKAMLRPLFETTEINLASARQKSGLHPLSPDPQNGPSQTIVPPDSFFLLESTFASLGVTEATGINSGANITPQDYKTFVANEGLKIFAFGRPAAPGDNNFAWFTPELGFVAVNWISLLKDRKVLSAAFIAAVLSVDHKRAIFSGRRRSLLEFIPDTMKVVPGERHPDQLTRDVIAKIQATNPPAGSAAAEFLALLRMPDPVQELRARVIAYRAEISQMDRSQLFKQMIERRREVQTHPLFQCLKESQALFAVSAPLPGNCS
jgi:hypothetical protein